MTETITVFSIKAWGACEVREVKNTGPELSKLVGGYLEVFYIPELTTDPMNSIIGLCDEEGWLKSNPAPNRYGPILSTRGPLAGDIVLVRALPNGEFGSLSDSDVTAIARHLSTYIGGNVRYVHIPRDHNPTPHA